LYKYSMHEWSSNLPKAVRMAAIKRKQKSFSIVVAAALLTDSNDYRNATK
jgi:hypothetical protein